MSTKRKPYPSDVSDAEWELPVPYPTPMREDAPRREYSSRDVLDAVRYAVRTGCPRDFLPHDFPPASAAYRQARRRVAAGAFEGIAHDLRTIPRRVGEREAQPTAVALDGRTPQPTPEGGARAGYDGARKRDGSEGQIAVDTLGHLLAVKVTAANGQERAQVAELTPRLREVTGGTVAVAFVDRGYTGGTPAEEAQRSGLRLEAAKRPEAGKGFVLLPRRRVVERTSGWLGRSRRLARDYERSAETLAGWHWLAFLTLLSPRLGLNSA
jgi:transposase